MQIIDQGWWLEHPRHRVRECFSEMISLIERAGRTCYKSEDKMTDSSGPEFVRKVVDSGHHSVIEHANVSVRVVTDRGVSHELVRHRTGIALSQESTRYANYSKDKFGKEITVIRPVWYPQELLDALYKICTPEYVSVDGLHGSDLGERAFSWLFACHCAEKRYMTMLEHGASPQEARSVLPNSLKTEVFMTANMREWRHIFNLRCAKAAHPQFRELALSMLDWFSANIPVLFDDLRKKYITPCNCGEGESCSDCANSRRLVREWDPENDK